MRDIGQQRNYIYCVHIKVHSRLSEGKKMHPLFALLPFYLFAWNGGKTDAFLPPAISAEFCESEVFNATCATGSVILMAHAKYGRMQKCRCVQVNYGHIGCNASVLELMDTRCSGRRRCEVRVPEMMLTNTRPCQNDLKSYLEASYRCVKVPTVGESACSARTSIHLHQPNGFLSSSMLSGNPHCDGSRLSWKIKAKPGQYIRVTLYDFHVEHRTSSSRDPYTYPGCHVYATVKERLKHGTRNVSVCGGDRRKKSVYTSATNNIEVILAPNKYPTKPKFLLQYEAFGCPDLVPVANSWLTRIGDNVKIRCNFTKDLYELKCVEQRWVGQSGNCSSALAANGKNTYTPEPVVPYGVSIIIVLGIALIIGLIVLAVGLLVLRRQSPCPLSGRPPASPATRDKDNVHNAWQEHRDSQLSYGRATWGTTDRTPYAGPELPPCTPLMDTVRKQSLYGQLQETTLPCGCSTYVTRAELGTYTPAINTLSRNIPVSKITNKAGQPAYYFVLDPGAKRITDTGSKRDSKPAQKDAVKNSFGVVAMETDDVKLRQRTSGGVGSCCADEDEVISPDKPLKYTQHGNAPDISYTAICKDSMEDNL